MNKKYGKIQEQRKKEKYERGKNNNRLRNKAMKERKKIFFFK
jgi:hypothetical protein